MSVERTAAYWDDEAARFDEEPDHGLTDPAVRDAWRGLLAEHLPAAPSDVVDLGCGTGSLSVLLAQQGHRVQGVDLSPAMVARARLKAEAAGVLVSFEVGDAADPPGAPASYDVVLVRHVLWALPDPADTLARWAALLRPGGRLLLVEGRWWTGAGIGAEECLRLVAGLGRPATLHRLEDERLWGRPTGDERYLVASPGHPGGPIASVGPVPGA